MTTSTNGTAVAAFNALPAEEATRQLLTCLAVPRLAAAAGVHAPIAEAVVQVLYENVPAREAVDGLMTRALRSE